jgi:hypothetical protein
VVQRDGPDGQRRLIPIGSAWFDQTTKTTKAIRVDDAEVTRASEFELE